MKVDHSSSEMLIPISWFGTQNLVQFEEALDNVGIGLSDILLLHVCYEYGLEECEKRLGWSARSGKVVLKIALERLVKFYAQENTGMIGKAY